MDTPIFGAHWRARLHEIRTLREERGATDPILIIAGIAITLILLVGGSFAVAGFMNNARNMNAKSDIERISIAMDHRVAMEDNLPLDAPGGFWYASGERIENVMDTAGIDVPTMAEPDSPSVDITISQGVEAFVLYIPVAADNPDKAVYGVFVRSETGEWYFRTQGSTKVWEFGTLNGDGSAVTPPAGFMDSDLLPNVKNQVSSLFTGLNGTNGGILGFH